jgi:hypothetical protein
MTKRTYTQKNGTIWEWEETPELLKALKELHDETSSNNKTTTVE